VSNAPGEITAWVATIVSYCAPLFDNSCQITLCLVPCQYASGQESTLASRIKGLSRVLSVKKTLKLCIGLDSFDRRYTRGAVLGLGGDPFYTQLLAWRSGFSASIYTEHHRNPGWFFKHVFYKHLHGDLMQSYCKQQLNMLPAPNHLKKKRPIILVLLGSRPAHFKAFGAFFIQALPLFFQLNQTHDVMINIAPTINAELEKEVVGGYTHPALFITQQPTLSLLKITDLMVSLPGTNTAEALFAQVPMLTVAPLNRPELVQIDGILGFIETLPWVGMALKRYIIQKMAKRIRFISLPNRLKQSLICPQLMAVLTPDELAAHIHQLAIDEPQLRAIKERLAAFEKGEPIVDTILTHILPLRTPIQASR